MNAQNLQQQQLLLLPISGRAIYILDIIIIIKTKTEKKIHFIIFPLKLVTKIVQKSKEFGC
jgi:hypothetical protein